MIFWIKETKDIKNGVWCKMTKIPTKDDVCAAYFAVNHMDTQGTKIRAVKFGPEIGTSGIVLPSYFDHRVVSANPQSSETIISYEVPFQYAIPAITAESMCLGE